MITESYNPIITPTGFATIIGFTSGFTTNSKLSGTQFVAENLHRLPRNRADWYFFQKTKNYKFILGGLQGGLKVGSKLGIWTLGFCCLKEGFNQNLNLLSVFESGSGGDRFGIKSISGCLSGLSIAIGSSYFYKLRPLFSPKRMLIGSLLGLFAGAGEDSRGYLIRLKELEEKPDPNLPKEDVKSGKTVDESSRT